MRVLMKLTARAAKGHGQNVSEPSSENQLKAAASWPAATHNSQLALKLATMPQQQQHQSNKLKTSFRFAPRSSPPNVPGLFCFCAFLLLPFYFAFLPFWLWARFKHIFSLTHGQTTIACILNKGKRMRLGVAAADS